jgi:hypothetical protein
MANDELNENSNNLKISARTERYQREIRERIKVLENRIIGYRKHGRRSGRDEAELGRLRDFLQSLNLPLVVCLAVACMSPLARADDISPLLASRAPCGPYMSARTCLDAIRAEAEACIARKFKSDATPAQQLACIDEALAATGGLDR